MLYATDRFVAHGADIGFRTNDPELRDLLNRVLAPLSLEGSPAGWVSVTRCDDGESYKLETEKGSSMTVNRGAIVPLVMSVLNHRVVRETNDRVLIHAAAAERDGVGIILPAPMEAGKTTTVAGLVRRGWRYLSDETVAINPDTLEIEPYHKPLSIDRGSWAILADLEPDNSHGFQSGQWQVPVTAVRDDALGQPCTPRFIVAPRYDKSRPTALRPISRGQMLLLLGESAFAGGVPHERAFPSLAALVRRCRCFELSVSSLDHGIDLLERLVNRP